ncbi:hypothetical protein AXG93_1104s1010 [Marchantia polymorpha subsp. ruderalis]|uniref:Plastocyanin-like domain-containing protein n=1 Tax=Marchantia polymorpha subsp. ruderalis TaxID=1480154 RepID=A0A176WNT6_MARPO|nr:hypothetical protein AXG93_1104s1010 [Marchantia polymorpha subsp. ruderalis]
MEAKCRRHDSRSHPGLGHQSSLHIAILIGLLNVALDVRAEPVLNESVCLHMSVSPALTPYIQELPRLPSIDISTGVQVTLGVYKVSRSVHPELPNTTFYCYGTSGETASCPGPNLEAKKDVTSYVRFENHLTDESHLFVVDPTLRQAKPPRGGIPLITHLHGAETEPKYDGHAEAWYTAAGDTGPAFVTRDREFLNQQPETLLWYHDHTLGYTRLNIVAGLLGLYFIRSAHEPPNLPSGEFEIPLVIQDKQFLPDGSINFPTKSFNLSVSSAPNWCPSYMGDVILVNGKAWPFLNVVRGLYRFRILNAASARTFRLMFSDSRVKIVQIGTDGGYVWTPVELADIYCPPAYRLDLLVDFSAIPVGSTIFLNNSYMESLATNNPTTARLVMKLNVVEGLPAQNVSIPTSLGPAPNLTEVISQAAYRQLTLSTQSEPYLREMLNLRVWSDPATEMPQLYSHEIWDIVNLNGLGSHIIHLHLVNFLLLEWQPVDVLKASRGLCSLSKPFGEPDSCFTEAPTPAESIGWKDTIAVTPLHSLKVLVPFFPRSGGSYNFDATAFPGSFEFALENPKNAFVLYL